MRTSISPVMHAKMGTAYDMNFLLSKMATSMVAMTLSTSSAPSIFIMGRIRIPSSIRWLLTVVPSTTVLRVIASQVAMSQNR